MDFRNIFLALFLDGRIFLVDRYLNKGKQWLVILN